LGIGDGRLGPIPNPQSPIPNPQDKLIKLINLFLDQKINIEKIIIIV